VSIDTGVKRGYAFGDDDVPRDADTEYLKVKYSAKNRAPPVSLCKRGGRCIEKILGAGSTPLEQFLIKRKLMGPCWVRIDSPIQRDSKVSWCVLEVEVSDSKKITVARDCPYSAPPLVCTTLSVKTAVNPKSHQHEIVARWRSRRGRAAVPAFDREAGGRES
jgi:DNA polymerase alpha subunit A